MKDGYNLYQREAMQDINPYVRFAKYDTLKPYHVIRERVIYDYEIVCIMQGTVTITIEDRSIEGKTGDLFFFKPGQRHSFTVHEAPLVQPHVHFDLVYTDNSSQKPVNHKPCSEMTENERSIISKDISDLFFQHFPSYIHLRNPMVMEQSLFEVIRAYQNPGLFPEIQTKACFLKLWLQLLNEVQWLQTEYCDIKVERAEAYKIYLEQNFNRRITMADLEDFISRGHIFREPTKKYMVYLRFIAMLRIE